MESTDTMNSTNEKLSFKDTIKTLLSNSDYVMIMASIVGFMFVITGV